MYMQQCSKTLYCTVCMYLYVMLGCLGVLRCDCIARFFLCKYFFLNKHYAIYWIPFYKLGANATFLNFLILLICMLLKSILYFYIFLKDKFLACSLIAIFFKIYIYIKLIDTTYVQTYLIRSTEKNIILFALVLQVTFFIKISPFYLLL